MTFRLKFTNQAAEQLHLLETDSSRSAQGKAVKKALGYMETNLKHQGLHTHEHTALSRKWGIKIFESYAPNNTPGAYRIFWHYGAMRGEIIVVAIIRHPD